MIKKSVDFLKNKKAQQSNWFLIVLVIAVIVLVVVALAITGAFGKIDEIFDKVDDLETTVQACNAYAQGELKTSYCTKFHKVELAGETQYVNCEFLEKQSNIDIENPYFGDCVIDNKTLLKICENKRIKDSEMVNGNLCGEDLRKKTCKGLGGEWEDDECGSDEYETFEVLNDFKEENKKCCVSE